MSKDDELNITDFAPHQQRVIFEKNELEEKYNKLTAFFSSDIFKALPNPEFILLNEQAICMKQYLDILKKRISLF